MNGISIKSFVIVGMLISVSGISSVVSAAPLTTGQDSHAFHPDDGLNLPSDDFINSADIPGKKQAAKDKGLMPYAEDKSDELNPDVPVRSYSGVGVGVKYKAESTSDTEFKMGIYQPNPDYDNDPDAHHDSLFKPNSGNIETGVSIHLP